MALFFLTLGPAWREMRVGEGAASAAYWCTVVGGYGSVASLLLAALLGTSRATPIAGAGYSAPAWQETLVTVALSVTGLPLFVACVILLRGFAGRATGGNAQRV
jgi:hydroxylaminobenzene mutase